MTPSSRLVPFAIGLLLAGRAPAQILQPPAIPQPGQAHPVIPNAAEVTDSAIYSPEPSVDFGEILQGEIRKHTFFVGNRGDKDIQVRSVNPTCGCTVAQVKGPDGKLLDPRQNPAGQDLLTLKPKEQCEVFVEFNSRGQPTQHIQKMINVISSDDKLPALQLVMNMTITSAIVVEPNPLQFGDVNRGERKTSRTYAKLTTLKELEITGWPDKPAYVDIATERAKAPDGTEAIAIDVTLKEDAPIGYVTPLLTATTSDARVQQLQVQIYANVKSEISFNSGNKINQERLDFEVIPFGEARTRELEIKNNNPALPYHVTKIEIDCKYQDQLQVATETIEDGKHYKIKLTTAPTLDARFFRGTLKIQSDSKDLPEKQIFFHGWVKKD